jgi:hypothetical protein
MPKFKNISPLGALDTPVAGRVVEAGEIIDLPADRAVFVAAQADTWEPADDEARELADAALAPPPEPDAAEPVAEPAATNPSAPAGAQGDEDGEVA